MMRAWARCLTQQRYAQRGLTQRELLLPLVGAVNRRVPSGSFTCSRRTVVQWSGSEGDGEGGKKLSFIQRQILREKEQEAQRERQLAMVVDDWRRRNPDQGEPPPGENRRTCTWSARCISIVHIAIQRNARGA